MIIDVIGSGPSLDLQEAKGNLTIWTNRSMYLRPVPAASDFGLVADERFVFDTDWQNLALNWTHHLFATRHLKMQLSQSFAEFRETLSLERLNFPAWNSYQAVVGKNEFPKMNVVLDYAIPLAVCLGAQEILLLGCDFDYGPNLLRPEYAQGAVSETMVFEHNRNSAKKWTTASRSRLAIAQKFLDEQGIALRQVNQ